MATCALSALIQQACANDFVTAANDVVLYRAIKHQLLCNIQSNGGGDGSLTPFTVQDIVSPGLPYSFTATERTHLEIGYQISATGGDTAALEIIKTGATSKTVGSTLEYLGTGVLSLILGPGDAVTLNDISDGVSSVTIFSITIYIG